MNDLNNLDMVNRNQKVILLNPRNGYWVRMPEKRYQFYLNNQDKKKDLYHVLDSKFDLFKEPELVKSELRSLYFSVTGKCNLRCSFCAMNSNPETCTDNDISLKEIEDAILPKLLGLNLKKIVITGGEPLCRPDIIEILKLFSEHYGRKRITLQSNGLLMDLDFVDKVKNYVNVIELSIENIFSNSKLLNHMESIFKKAQDCGIKLSLSFVVDHDSHQYLQQAIDTCYKYDADFTMRIVSLIGRANETTWNNFLEPLNQLKIHLEAINYIMEKNYFSEKLIGRYFTNLTAKKSCGAFGKILALHPNGDAFMCGNFKDKKFSMGNLRILTVEEIIKNLEDKMCDKAYQELFYVTHMAACKDCEVKYFCSGQCPAEVAESSGESGFVDLKCLTKKAAISFNMFYYDRKKTYEENLFSYRDYLEDIIYGRIVV